MDKTTLVEQDLKKGEELLAMLDKSKVKTSGAFWRYLEEDRLWKLYFVMKPFDEKGYKAAYLKVQPLLYSLSDSDIALTDISFVKSHDPLIEGLKRSIKTKPKAIERHRLTRSSINNVYVDELIIYRMS